MARRGGPEGALGGLGVRGARARVSPVDEAAMQAKLRELRSVVAKERTARTEVHSAMEANGGRIWSSSKPTTLRSRDGGLKLRELTAEELERIQRAKDRAAASDRAAAIAAVTTGRARSRSGRRVLDPLDKSVVVSAFAASARSRPGSASSSGPQSPRVEHVVVRATNSVYAPPLRGNARWAREGAPDGAILSDAVTRPAPRPPAARPGSRPGSARRVLSARESGLSGLPPSARLVDGWHPDANDMIEPMGDPEPAGGRAFRRAGDAEAMTFGDDDHHDAAVVAIETPSLLEGALDEAANRAAFAEALREWRGGGTETRTDAPASETEKENAARSRVSAGGSLLDGTFDEAANRRAFAEALDEWRGEPNAAAKKKSQPTESPATETQTESPASAAVSRNARPAAAKPSAPPGASYFERLRFGNVERLAGWDAADAVRRGSGKGRQ